MFPGGDLPLNQWGATEAGPPLRINDVPRESLAIPFTGLQSMPSLEIERQQPNRAEIVTFGAPYSEVLPQQISRLGISRAFAVLSKSLTQNSSELQTLKSVLGDKLVGVKIGVGAQRYFPSLSSLTLVISTTSLTF